MIAVEIRTPGGPEVLTAVERQVPVPGPGEVLVRVAAAGVNRPDVMQRQGRYPPPPGASDIPGLEVAGEVVQAGPASGLAAGDQVCALVAGGGYAEYCLAAAALCLPVPRGLDLVAAAALPETYFTVWANVFERGALRAAETLLVHGGASGIGTTAIQLARARGARVFTTVGSGEKRAACEALGAERAVVHTHEDFVAVVKQATGGRGVDVILDMIGGGYFPRNLELLATDGRLVHIAAQHGSKVELDIWKLMARRLVVTGTTLRPRTVAEKAQIAAALRAEVWPLLESGAVRPVVHATFPLREAAAAHRLLESSTHVGKIVLVCRA